MFFLNPVFKRAPWFEHPQIKKDKELQRDNDPKMAGFGFLPNFRDRLATAGVFQGEVVNVDYSDFNGVVKRAVGAPLTIIGSNFIELSSDGTFPVFSIISGMPVPFVELVRTLIIPISNILDVRKA